MALLAKTRGKDSGVPGLDRMVALSLLIHVLVLSILFLSPSLPARKWTFGPVYTVDLVNLPPGYLERKASTEISKEVSNMGIKEHSTVLKKSPESLSVPPVKRITPVKRETGRDIEKALEGVRKRVETSSAHQTQPTRETAGESRVMNAYYEVLWARIKAEWALPRGILPSENLEAVLDVTVSRSGNVTSLSIERTSGNRYFDQSAIRAIRKASPFPPIPEDIRGSSIDLGIRFHSAQFR